MKTAEELIKEKKLQDVISVTPDTTIHDAVQKLKANKIGSMIIMEHDKVLGVWTERDLLHNILTDGFNLRTAKIGDYMIKDLHYAEHTDPAYILLDKFLGLRFRHILVEKNGNFLGMLSMGDVVKYILREKFAELKQKNKEVSWEYYEEWKWGPQD